MSGLSGYFTIEGVDLSYVFMPLSKGSTYPTPTRYLLSNGNDLTSIFAAKSNATISYNTGLLTSNGTDLTDIFNDINGAPYVTPTIGTGISYTTSVEPSGATYKYTITFTPIPVPIPSLILSLSTTIHFDKSITNLNVIVVGGGGGWS